MTRTNRVFKTSSVRAPAGNIFVAMIALLVLGCAQWTFAQSRPKTFASASEASQALYDAVHSKDEQAVQAILGAGPEVASSGDDAEDKLERERFVQKYQEMHRLVQEPDGFTALYIGAENWPFPIPLASRQGKWYFDSDAGEQEIMFRRVGQDEATAIQVCQQVAVATRQQATEQQMKAVNDDPATDYAQHLIAAGAASDGPIAEKGLFQGYYFRILRQSTSAATRTDAQGAVGRKATGVVLIAYPAHYRVSGVMTFIVTGSGSNPAEPGPFLYRLPRSHGKPQASDHLLLQG